MRLICIQFGIIKAMVCILFTAVKLMGFGGAGVLESGGFWGNSYESFTPALGKEACT
jgi:hypothetical protein